MKRAIIILGPTSTGKTNLALFLAKKFNGEIISSDSRQVYKGLDIGTGKIPDKIINSKLQIIKGENFWEIDGVKIHCLDVTDPKKQYTVKNFVDDATQALEKIIKENKLPIIVGGSGLYIKALTEGIKSLSIPRNKKLRKELEKLSIGELQRKIRKISIERWNSMNNSDRQNKRRLIRAIELIPMYPYRKKIQNSKFKIQKYNYLKIGLMAPIRVLREKIRRRVNLRFKQGLIKEAKKLHRSGLSIKRMKELGLDYKILAEYLEGELDEKSLREKIYLRNGQYAKRQMTWFKKEEEVNWFDVTKRGFREKVERLVSVWYD